MIEVYKFVIFFYSWSFINHIYDIGHTILYNVHYWTPVLKYTTKVVVV